LGGIYGGRFAVALGGTQRTYETSDGGMTWAPFDLPEREEEARAAPSRACGPVGCALPGWVRVGWGEAEDADDMKPAKAPTVPYTPFRVSPTIHLACSATSLATPPLPDKRPPIPAPRVTVRPRGGPFPVGVAVPAGVALPRGPQHDTAWAAFRNTEPPALAADEFGVDNGSNQNEATALRAYAWGRSGADWTRGGRWLVRFDDPFDPSGGVRSSALTASLWATQTEAVDGIGTNPYSGTSWAGYLDPSGRSLLASACSRSTGCVLYAIAEGQPVLPYRGLAGGGQVGRPFDHGAIRVGETWYFVAPTPSYDGIALWRAELGVARQIATYHRVQRYSNFALPRLVRRAAGASIGMLIAGGKEPSEPTGSWYVLPIDPETGALGEAVVLTRRDLAGASLARCVPGQDGWMFDVTPETTTAIDVDNARARFEPVEMRLRLDPGRACVESFAARSDPFFANETGPTKGLPKLLSSVPARKGGLDEAAVPLAATEKQSGRRWGLTCRIQR
jgi:hypothetical protein